MIFLPSAINPSISLLDNSVSFQAMDLGLGLPLADIVPLAGIVPVAQELEGKTPRGLSKALFSVLGGEESQNRACTVQHSTAQAVQSVQSVQFSTVNICQYSQ